MHRHEHPWDQAPPWAYVIGEQQVLILEGLGKIMSTFDDLTTQLNAMAVEVATIKTDVDTLLAKLAAVPPAGLTAAQQSALDAAVAAAQNINTKLDAIDVETHSPAVGPLPVLTSIAPNSGPTSGNTSVTLTGTGFTGATGVSIDNILTTNMTVVSDTSITAATPAGPTGAQSVIVSTPNGSNVANTLYSYVAVAPVLTSVSPTSGPVTGATPITLTGTGFTGTTNVTVGGAVTPFTVVNDTTITLTTSTGSGVVPIVVTTPAGVSDGTVMFTFGVPTAPVGTNPVGTGPITGPAVTPTITSIAPTSGPVAGGTSVILTGTGFTGASAVTFGGVAASSFNVVSDTMITAMTGAGVVGAGQAVLVTTPGGTNLGNTMFAFV
jgi:hypothetical protein